MPEFMKNDGTPAQNEAKRAELTAFATKHGVDMKQFGAGQQPAKPAGTPDEVAALHQHLTSAPTIASMSAQAAKSVADQVVASQLWTAEQKHGSPLSFTEKAALEIQLRAKVGRALAIDGHSEPAGPFDPELAALHREAGIPLNVDPAAYQGLDFNRPELDTEHKANAQAVFAKWASELQLEPHLASSLAQHIPETTANLAKATPDDRVKWSARQTESLLKSQNGDPKKVEALIAKAHRVLAMSTVIKGPLGEERFSEALKNNVIGKSAFLIRTLAAQADALDLLAKGKKQL